MERTQRSVMPFARRSLALCLNLRGCRWCWSAIFSWAMGEGLCQHNPVVGTNKAAPAVSRDRVLSDAETGAIWNEADEATDFGKIVRLLFLTGCRRAEIGGLCPSEIALGELTDCTPGEPHQERAAARCAAQRARQGHCGVATNGRSFVLLRSARHRLLGLG